MGLSRLLDRFRVKYCTLEEKAASLTTSLIRDSHAGFRIVSDTLSACNYVLTNDHSGVNLNATAVWLADSLPSKTATNRTMLNVIFSIAFEAARHQENNCVFDGVPSTNTNSHFVMELYSCEMRDRQGQTSWMTGSARQDKTHFESRGRHFLSVSHSSTFGHIERLHGRDKPSL